jgi:hypothetical protein
MSLAAVNATLLRAVLDDQRRYARLAVKAESQIPKSVLQQYPGIYETSPQRKLTSASTVVVSSLIPVVQLFPGGNDGSTWISATVEVPSGSAVTISQLFANPAAGLRGLATAVLGRLTAENGCARRSLRDPVVGKIYARGLSPVGSHYRYFALTPTGLGIGFANGEVAAAACGRVEITIPYAAVRGMLGVLGARLIAGVRAST